MLELDSQYEQALANYEEMEQAAHRLGDPGMELDSLMARVTIRAAPTPVRNQEWALTLGDRALALAQDTDDRAAEAKILWLVWDGRDNADFFHENDDQ